MNTSLAAYLGIRDGGVGLAPTKTQKFTLPQSVLALLLHYFSKQRGQSISIIVYI